ncbi:MAG: hypothetical protein ACKV19_28705 [Verrucomicrobiales bacterium]
MINETTYPAAGWLLGHGLWYDTDLHTDSDGEGVNLLMAYALDLNPHQNLQASLPVPVVSETTLSLNFHSAAPSLTYRAETSTDLTNWTTVGVTQSAPGPARTQHRHHPPRRPQPLPAPDRRRLNIRVKCVTAARVSLCLHWQHNSMP